MDASEQEASPRRLGSAPFSIPNSLSFAAVTLPTPNNLSIGSASRNEFYDPRRPSWDPALSLF